MIKARNISLPFWLVLLEIDFIWLRSSWGKLSEGKFVGGMNGTLTKFASNNPYPWVKTFLQTVALPNASIFGVMTMWGEFLVAISTLVGLLLLLKGDNNTLTKMLLIAGFTGGAFLNLVFYFSSGWTSPSTDGLNLLMIFVQLGGVLAVIRD